MLKVEEKNVVVSQESIEFTFHQINHSPPANLRTLSIFNNNIKTLFSWKWVLQKIKYWTFIASVRNLFLSGWIFAVLFCPFHSKNILRCQSPIQMVYVCNSKCFSRSWWKLNCCILLSYSNRVTPLRRILFFLQQIVA